MDSSAGGGDEPPARRPKPVDETDLAGLKMSLMAYVNRELAVRDEEIVELQRRVAALDGGPEE